VLFLALYALITIKLVLWVRKAAALRDTGKKFPLKAVNAVATIVLANAIVYQILHHYEHVTQIFQYWYLEQYSLVSRGVVFFLDLEWNHFIFDSGYFLLLLGGILFFLRQWKAAGHAIDRLGGFLLYGTIVVQGWHAIEHTYRIIRHVREGCEPCRGIADKAFDLQLIPLHFWFNVFALTLPLLAFFYYRMDAKLLLLIREAFTKRR